ncbi:tRNA (pseudouridine(54)-N(1))-methyltransferase TrmY [Nanoarchaeota archaeon]
MREFVYYSQHAPTTGNFDSNLMKAGRMDIAVHVVIASFFLSHQIREDTKLHLIFAGMPDPQKHLEIQPRKEIEPYDHGRRVDLSKKDVSGLIKRMLYKYKKGRKIEAFPGYFIEKNSFLKVIRELQDQGKDLYVLDPKGEDIRTVNIGENPVFVLGDHEGIPTKELKRLKKELIPVSIGKKKYFASQTVAIVNNEIDRREEKIYK